MLTRLPLSPEHMMSLFIYIYFYINIYIICLSVCIYLSHIYTHMRYIRIYIGYTHIHICIGSLEGSSAFPVKNELEVRAGVGGQLEG